MGSGGGPGRASSLAEAAGGRRQWCDRIRRCGGCGGGEGAALGGAMVDGVEGEQLRKGRQLQTMGGGGFGPGRVEIFRVR
jgi:hypothetical protein